MRFDLKSIETFIYVAQLKSFIGAAEKLNIAKSHVSTRISELERKAEMTLLARTTRDVNLTGEGEEFLQHCEKIMDQVQILEDFLNSLNEH